MYFSVLPLLLLFSSAICAQASPIHIKSRMDSSVPPATSLAASHKNNPFYGHFSSLIEQHGGKPVMGLPGALQKKYDGHLLMRVEIAKTAVPVVKNMILDLSGVSWGWDNILHNRIAVVLKLQNPEDEEIVKTRLCGH